MTSTHPLPGPVGQLLREWRMRRRRSQLDLALDADVSARHLSFLETGRARPSREMLLRLAEELAVPLRDRNELLLAAGFAPRFEERPLDDPSLRAARAAVDLVLAGHEPFPALAVDRHWNLVAFNRSVMPLLAGVSQELLQPPVNVLRLSLHPGGLAPAIVNAAEWRTHLLARLRRQVDLTRDATLVELLRELGSYTPTSGTSAEPHEAPLGTEVFVPLRLRTPAGVLSFISTTTVFGTAIEVTLSELVIEAFFPADEWTGEALRQLRS